MEPLTLTLIFLLAYFCAVVFSRLTGLSVIVGFLLIGAMIALVIPDLLELRHSIELLTEIGVAFLLFEVGSHLPLKNYWAHGDSFSLRDQLKWPALRSFFILL